MLKAILLAAVVLVGIAGLPIFPHARRWGYTVPATALIVLFILIVLISLGALG